MDERAEIEAAMDRLLEGIPLQSDGKLTIVSLAAEAGVKRHVLTHKHTDLRDRFNARVKAQNTIPASETALRQQNDELRRKLDGMRAERDEYKQAADALARALNVLVIENDELHCKTNRTGQPMEAKTADLVTPDCKSTPSSTNSPRRCSPNRRPTASLQPTPSTKGRANPVSR